MTTLLIPTAEQISAALESLLDTASRAYDATDRADTEERAFWRRQRNAYINALADVAAGRLPLLSGNAYLVPSASRAGSYHRCHREGGVWICSCEAGERGDFHRHTALIGAIEQALEYVERGLVGEYDAGELLAVPDDQPEDDFSDVGERAPVDSPALVERLVSRLSAARAQRYAMA